WLVVAEIRIRRRTRERVRQKGEQRHHVGLFDHLRPLRSLMADHHVDGHLAVGIQRKIERLELMVSGELLVEAGGRIETGNDASDRVAPVGKFSLAQRKPLAQRVRITSMVSSPRLIFQRAIALVKALSSTSSWYSSGPITWRICRLPSASVTARDAQKRAVSSRISAPASMKNASSPVARQYCHTA